MEEQKEIIIQTFDEYQKEAVKTMGPHWDDFDTGLAYGALGLVGEAGEIAEKVKKYINKSKPLDTEDIKKELGDVMWYVASLAKHLDLSFDDIVTKNIKKLRKRHGESFSGYGNREGEGK